jgi:predicted DNA-binding transcriptional regulator YafY
MSQEIICDAIQQKRLVQFWYDGGNRTVEPHMIATNEAGHRALSAWFVSGHSNSGERPGWREFLLSEIRNAAALNENFAGPRPGYKPDGGKKFNSVTCAL